MKSMISSEVRRRGLNNNIKLGAGGIREVEFIAQSFQLIRGGREPSLRHRGLLKTLAAMKQLTLLPEGQVIDLEQGGYCFLRKLENLLQAIDDKQTQTLPDQALDQHRLAYAMGGYADWPALQAAINGHMDAIHQVFENIVGTEDEEIQSAAGTQYHEMWAMVKNEEVLLSILDELAAPEGASQASTLLGMKAELSKRTLGPSR